MSADKRTPRRAVKRRFLECRQIARGAWLRYLTPLGECRRAITSDCPSREVNEDARDFKALYLLPETAAMIATP